jgi:Cft2 family RNA processing exonuclease
MTPPDFRPDILFLESTNGCHHLPSRQQEVERLVRTAGRFRFALIPAFGVGRSPDVALDIASYNFPVYLDGMGKKILMAYTQEEFSWCENDRTIPKGLLERIKFVKGEQEREKLARDFSPKAVVTTGGMMTGPALTYASRWLGMNDAAVLDVGYVAKNTPGGKLLQSVETGMPFEIYPGESIKVAAHVERFALSAHIDGPQNVALVEALRPGKIYLGHGESQSRQGLAGMICRGGFDAEAMEEEQIICF